MSRYLLPSATARRTASAVLSIAALGAGAYACRDSTAPSDATRRVYGTAVALGNGHARSYVVLDAKSRGGAPLEFGVAFDEGAMENLPAPMNMPAGTDPHAHADSHEYLLPLPAENPTPYRLVELDWNPGGHEPPGIYDIPHFDFHFYTISRAERDAIDPSIGDSAYAAKSAAAPPAGQVAASYAALAAPGTAPVAVPHMGVHWSDVRSPELQGMFGHPEAYKAFTTTFIYGAWDGHFIFGEPMITRAYILAKKSATTAAGQDETIPVSVPAQFAAPGYYPSAYRIAWDGDAKEYRIALTQLARRG